MRLTNYVDEMTEMSISEEWECTNARDNTPGSASCSSQISGGTTCKNYISIWYKDCDKSCNLCPCSTGTGTKMEHCSGHGICEGVCTDTNTPPSQQTCSNVKCKCDPGWKGSKCELFSKFNQRFKT